MEVITSHNSLDFDGLAAMVAAGKVYPSAVKVFSGTLSKNVKQFLALYKDSLAIKFVKDIEVQDIERLIIVDTANAARLGQLADIARSPNIDLHIYDHHPSMPDDLRGSINEIHYTGAGTTILVEKIMASGLFLSAFDATILALGIYEDTGSLSFSTTTVRDAAAVTFLLGMGANLSVISKFIDRPFNEEQRLLLQELLRSTRHYNIHNREVVFAFSKSEGFVADLDAVAFRLFELENCDAIFVIAEMEGKLNVVSRSRSNQLKVNQIMSAVGGRGHEKAASAVVREKSQAEVLSLLLDSLQVAIDPGLTARDVMSTPVKTVSSQTSMKEAGKILLRYGHSGMPVTDGEKMVGVISRRDIDKAIIHKLAHAPVKGFMSRAVKYIEPDTPIEEVQKKLIEYDIGRLPVLEDGKLMGIISRTDILKILHGDEIPEDHALLYTRFEDEHDNVQNLMKERLPAKFLKILRIAGELADHMGLQVYCVGGFVRDLILYVPNFDIDIVVVGEGEAYTEKLAERLNGRFRIHERFKTGVVILDDGSKIDVATSRKEYYEFPAALPQIEKSVLHDDLFRRDFTINTLAIAINHLEFGNLIDYFGGSKDLEKGLIRILYNFSFFEDPTRIFRAIRFEQRYGFTIEQDTLRFAKDAAAQGLLAKLSSKRVLNELILILNEKSPLPSLERILQIGVWDYVLPGVGREVLQKTSLKRIPLIIAWCDERYSLQGIKTWLVFILELVSELDNEQLENFINYYQFDRYVIRCLRESREVKQVLPLLKNKKLLASDLHAVVEEWCTENLILLLLAIRDEGEWTIMNNYLFCRERTKVEITGRDLIKLGIKTGPIYSLILRELYYHKLDGFINNKREEISQVKRWIEEGYFIGY